MDDRRGGRQESERRGTGQRAGASAGALPWHPAKGWRPWSLAEAFARIHDSAVLEIEARRLFLWVPVCAGTGVVLYMTADHEPAFWAIALLFSLSAAAAWLSRHRPWLFGLSLATAAIFAGMGSAGWRTMRIAAPVLDRVRIVTVVGHVEQVDLRREGARIVLRIDTAEGLAPEATPYRVRVTTKRDPGFEAGAYISTKARLLPPSRASLPGGYDFARDAFFARIGAVGSLLGKAEIKPPPVPPGLIQSLHMSIDRMRNVLARRVAASVEGDAGAIAVAMVTGKRDFLTEEARELVREAGIFHIITISGVQMTLVAGILFFFARFSLALIPGFALRYPIKKWAAIFAMTGAVAYDIMTGSRVGTERALFMTMIMLTAVIVGRPALTMRNLALAAIVVIAFEPEAIMGASFQLSFAAVAALVAVYEARVARMVANASAGHAASMWQPQRSSFAFDPISLAQRFGHWIRDMGLATLCATAATASFMAYDFHELSPYVLIGNPLTLTLIEFFAVPGALIGSVLYPIGLDGPVWAYVGMGIRMVLEVARWIAAAPGSTIHLADFAPWSIAFLAMAVLCVVIWRTWTMRLTAVPFALIGLGGTLMGQKFDIVVPPNAESVAVRGDDGRLSVIGRRPNAFATEQWLRADGDGRKASSVTAGTCDKLACVGTMMGGRSVSVIYDRAAFAEDCHRVDIIVTTEYVPSYCQPKFVITRKNLDAAGAVAIRMHGGDFEIMTARSKTEDRPWSPLRARASANWPVAQRAPPIPDTNPYTSDADDLPDNW